VDEFVRAAVSAAASVAAAAVVTVVPGADAVGAWLVTDRYWSSQPAATERFVIAVGDTIEPGRPGPGAGEIASPGQVDIYEFVGSAGQWVFLEVLSVDGDPDCTDAVLHWNLYDADGASVIPGASDARMGVSAYAKCADRGPLELPASGTYELHVFAGFLKDDPATGSYALRLLDAGAQDLETS
jgi:hypothetical protein